MKKDFFIKILDYDRDTQISRVKWDFLDCDREELIWRTVQESKIIKVVISFKIRLHKTYEQLKLFYLTLKTILLHHNCYTKEAEHALDEQLKRSIWPVQWIELGGEPIPAVKDKTTASIEDMCFLQEKTFERYEHIPAVKKLKDGIN